MSPIYRGILFKLKLFGKKLGKNPKFVERSYKLPASQTFNKLFGKKLGKNPKFVERSYKLPASQTFNFFAKLFSKKLKKAWQKPRYVRDC